MSLKLGSLGDYVQHLIKYVQLHSSFAFVDLLKRNVE